MESGEETDDVKDENVLDSVPEEFTAEASTIEGEQEQQEFETIDEESDDALKLPKEDMPETESPIEGEEAEGGDGVEDEEDENEDEDEEEKGESGDKGEDEGAKVSKGHHDKEHHKDKELEPKPRDDSIVISKTRISYDMKPRHDELEDFEFPGEVSSVINLQTQKSRYYSYMSQKGEEEEEPGSIVLEEEVPKIDRTPYYARREVLEPIIQLLKCKNGVLHKKLAIFFRRRKMDQVLRESDQIFDSAKRYYKHLDNLSEVLEKDKTQRTVLNNELAEMKAKRDEKEAQLDKMFQEMQKRERDIGTGLIYTKTGNEIPEKLVERLIRRQNLQMDTVCKMRLKYIVLKELVAEKQQAIIDLDNIGEGLHLVDYEQLKSENRSFADKIEEKEEELARLRSKCQSTTQILAHIREKSAALDVDIDELNDELQFKNMMHFQTRERLNELKQERDRFRHMINKLRNESGLLTEPILLRDMEDSIEELRLSSKELEELKQENKLKTRQLKNIRRNIEIVSDESYRRRNKSEKQLTAAKSSRATIYKGKASIIPLQISEKSLADSKVPINYK